MPDHLSVPPYSPYATYHLEPDDDNDPAASRSALLASPSHSLDGDHEEKDDHGTQLLTFSPTSPGSIPRDSDPSPSKSTLRPRFLVLFFLLLLFALGYFIRYLSAPPPPTFAATLAASHSLTPSTILPSLPFPPSPLGPDATLTFIKRKWFYKSGGSNGNLEFVWDPFGSGEVVLRLDYPKGKVGEGVGGLHLEVLGNEEDKVQRSLLAYDVAFSPGFDFVKGGKLPGLFGGNRKAGCSGGKHSDECFSLRLMWRPHGDGEVYAYIPTYDDFCTLDPLVFCESTYGTSIGRSSFNLTVPPSSPSASASPSPWNSLTLLSLLNTPPSTANGVVSLYHNSRLAFSDSTVLLRTRSDVQLGDLFFSSFFGGGDKSWAGRGGQAYFRRFEFFTGEDASAGDGKVVSK